MEVDQVIPDCKPEVKDADVKGNGLKRKHGNDANSDSEDFLGFDLAEQNDSQNLIQNIKKLCDSSSDEMAHPKRLQGIRTTNILDPLFMEPFKYGWRRELVLRSEPTLSKEKGEVYYITPTGKKLRTRHEILGQLNDQNLLTINNFTLVKEAIGNGTEEWEIIRPAKFYNYTRRSNVDPVITEATPPLGKRVPKPKMPKGASPPPSHLNFPATPTSSSTAQPLFTSNNNNKANLVKENVYDGSKAISPTRKPSMKGKLKGDARCTIHCLLAKGKIPSLQCKVCLCLYHNECAKVETGTSTFTCENCNFKFNKAPSNVSSSKKHPTPQQDTHNFEKSPQTLVTTLNGNKFIVFESEVANGLSKKTSSALTTNKLTEPAKPDFNRSRSGSVTSVSPFNFSSNFLRNVSDGWDILLHIFQFLKVQELQRCSRVCRLWRAVASSAQLWRTVRMKNSHINDWAGFIRTLQRNGTVHLDLRKMLISQNQEEAWREFSEKIRFVDELQGIDLCRCNSNVVGGLFESNRLKTLNAVSIKDETISFEALKNQQPVLEELRLRSVHSNGLQVESFEVAPLLNLRHLSLTTVKNLQLIFNDNSILGELTALESLELGYCDQLADEQFAGNLAKLQKLQRLRIEKGSDNFNINKVLEVVAHSLKDLVQLELINCDVKSNFVESIRQCRNIKKLLLIPTYVSQSAATNYMIMDGLMHLDSLQIIHWIVTNELLRVTELYLDQSDHSDKGKKSPGKQFGGASSPVKARDCIPVLKPVPGKEDTDDADNGNKQQQAAQVEIVALKIVEEILQKKLASTTVKLLKISHQNTWRQILDSQ